MKQLARPRFGKVLSLIAVIGAMFIALSAPISAAELVMIEQPGCAWCAAFDREIAPAYAKTEEGQRAPLRRLTLGAPLPADLTFLQVERLTPQFILVENGREIGRIRGYPGDDHFWGLLGALVKKLDTIPTGRERTGAVKLLLIAA